MIAMVNDLANSGIPKKLHRKLQVKQFKEEETLRLTGYPVASYAIPYFDIHNTPTGFFRIKFLEPVKDKDSKSVRYWQKANTLPSIYFTPVVNWSKIIKDPSVTITITEGEKKAICACHNGVVTISIGGVWSWRSKRFGVPFIEDLECVDWEGRTVRLCFDSDINSNPQVVKALSALALELVNRGATVETVTLPADNGEKLGLDDFIVKYGVDEYHALEAELFSAGVELNDLNEELAVIPGTGIYSFVTGKFITRDTLINVEYAHRNITIPDGDKIKEINSAAQWLKWKYRRTHTDIVYAPGQPHTIENKVNTWRAWGCTPKKGSVKPFYTLINHVFKENEEIKKWFLQWLAYPIQHPGTKLLSAVLLYGPSGVGKSLIGYIMREIYGPDNWVLIGEDELHAPFNDWAVNRQFSLGDEISGSDKRRDHDRLKNIITRETITVNAKYQPVYQLRDCCNYIFTSNHHDAFFIEQDDRRMLIWEILQQPMTDAEYAIIDKWKNGPGPAALFYHLLHQIDCKGFNPKARPPNTHGKEDMIDISASDLDMFCRMLHRHPDSVLRMGNQSVDRDLFTVAELIQFLPEEKQRTTSWIALSKALKRAGHLKLPTTRTAQGVVKLWAVRNLQRWRKATSRARADHYLGADAPQAAPGGKVTPIRRKSLN